MEQRSPEELKRAQQHMEEKVYQIWTVLSAFEESSAGCISEMLLHVSNGAYYDGVQMAEKFILHVEILFSAIDDLEAQMKEVGDKNGNGTTLELSLHLGHHPELLLITVLGDGNTIASET